MEPAVLLASTVAKQQRFWGSATVIVALLVVANVALCLVVYARRLGELLPPTPTASSPSAARCGSRTAA